MTWICSYVPFRAGDSGLVAAAYKRLDDGVDELGAAPGADVVAAV